MLAGATTRSKRRSASSLAINESGWEVGGRLAQLTTRVNWEVKIGWPRRGVGAGAGEVRCEGEGMAGGRRRFEREGGRCPLELPCGKKSKSQPNSKNAKAELEWDLRALASLFGAYKPTERHLSEGLRV
jgi:hypothetical protein